MRGKCAALSEDDHVTCQAVKSPLNETTVNQSYYQCVVVMRQHPSGALSFQTQFDLVDISHKEPHHILPA